MTDNINTVREALNKAIDTSYSETTIAEFKQALTALDALGQAMREPAFWYDEEDALLYKPGEQRPAEAYPLYRAAPPAQQAQGYSAADMATAAAQGYRDGIASVQGELHIAARYKQHTADADAYIAQRPQLDEQPQDIPFSIWTSDYVRDNLHKLKPHAETVAFDETGEPYVVPAPKQPQAERDPFVRERQQLEQEWRELRQLQAQYKQPQADRYSYGPVAAYVGRLKAELDDCKRAAQQAEAVPQWQPIETAPKDETPIILGYAPDGDDADYVGQGRWHEEDHDGPDNMGHDAGFMDDRFEFFRCARSFGASAYQHKGTQPTHWMPLPAAPQKEQSNA